MSLDREPGKADWRGAQREDAAVHELLVLDASSDDRAIREPSEEERFIEIILVIAKRLEQY